MQPTRPPPVVSRHGATDQSISQVRGDITWGWLAFACQPSQRPAALRLNWPVDRLLYEKAREQDIDHFATASHLVNTTNINQPYALHCQSLQVPDCLCGGARRL
jgi:hypothetical protein